jgi:hypothetical protein
MLVDEARALTLIEHRARDVARETSFSLGARKLGDASVDLGANVGSEGIQPFAKELPLCANEARHVGEAAAARIAAAPARPPRTLVGYRVRARREIIVDGEEARSLHDGFIQLMR